MGKISKMFRDVSFLSSPLQVEEHIKKGMEGAMASDSIHIERSLEVGPTPSLNGEENAAESSISSYRDLLIGTRSTSL